MLQYCRVSGKICDCSPRCEPDDYERDEPIVARELTIDEHLDDPRRGQARELNRRPWT